MGPLGPVDNHGIPWQKSHKKPNKIRFCRDSEGSAALAKLNFEPQLIPKHQTRWSGFDDKILSLYARGMTVREIQSHLEEMYGTEVSPTLISSVTDAVMCLFY
ncbi:Transposase, mutator type [Burkholderiales bacterium]